MPSGCRCHTCGRRPTAAPSTEWQGKLLRFPGIQVRGELVWGLTYRVLKQWAALVGKPLPGHDDPPYERVG